MLQLNKVTFGNLHGSIYDFPETGDILPMHTHDEKNVHITIILRGSFLVKGSEWEMISKAGEIIDWKAGQHHEMTSLEPNSRFINFVKGIQNGN